jgi:hypothetical protein
MRFGSAPSRTGGSPAGGNSLEARIPQRDPTLPSTQLGAQSAQAVTHVVNGVRYVYLIGGLQRYIVGGGTQTERGLKTVFYARVGAGGLLYKPSNGAPGWDRTADIPVFTQGTADKVGIWEAAAMADNYIASSQAAADAIYVVGGQTQPSPSPEFSPWAYRATIAGNGQLSWTLIGQMATSRHGEVGVSFRGNLYLTGGHAGGTVDPDRGVLTSYVLDDLTLPNFTQVPAGAEGNGTNFLKSDALPDKRTYHGSTLVRAGATSPTSAFIYVIGGVGTEGGSTTNAPRDTIIIGKVGGSEDISYSGYAQDGWYYSKPFDVAQQFAKVTVQEISWTTIVTRTTATMDIALDYRVASANNCSSATAQWSGWASIDGAVDANFSANGQNSSVIGRPDSRCFQYRAKLSTSNQFVSPLLLNVSVKIIVPGTPDLNTKTFGARKAADGALTGLNVVIQNLNKLKPAETLPANFNGPGTFWVDLCIIEPGKPVPAVTLPWSNSNKGCSKAYAGVDKAQMGPQATYSITQWYDTAKESPVNLLTYFTKTGTYKVIVVVDSYNYVNEGQDPTVNGEANNVTIYDVVVPKTRWLVAVPLVRR